MIKRRVIENMTCAFIIIYSASHLIYSISYISDIAKYNSNNLTGPIFNALALLSFLSIALICLFSQNRKILFITLSIICIILFIYSFILNINSIKEFQIISDEIPLSFSLTVSRYLALINIPLIILFVLSTFCITANTNTEEKNN